MVFVSVPAECHTRLLAASGADAIWSGDPTSMKCTSIPVIRRQPTAGQSATPELCKAGKTCVRGHQASPLTKRPLCSSCLITYCAWSHAWLPASPSWVSLASTTMWCGTVTVSGHRKQFEYLHDWCSSCQLYRVVCDARRAIGMPVHVHGAHFCELARSLLPAKAPCPPCDERLQALPVWFVSGVATSPPGGAPLDAHAPHSLGRWLQLHEHRRHAMLHKRVTAEHQLEVVCCTTFNACDAVCIAVYGVPKTRQGSAQTP